MIVVLRRTQKLGQRGERHLSVAAQRVRHRGELVTTVAALTEDAPADQSFEQL